MTWPSLDRAWRLIGTGLAFASFGIGGALLALTVFRYVAWRARDEAERIARTRRLVKASFRVFLAMLRRLGVIELTVLGRERLAGLQGAVVVANHPSLLDVVLLVALIPNAQCVVKHQLWRNPFLRRVVAAAGYLRNDQPPEDFMACCVRSLQAGENLLIFPEGTRTRPGEPVRLQRSFANIAQAAGAAIQVLTIRCEPTTLTKGSRWYEIPQHRVRYAVAAAHRIAPTGPDDLPRSLRARRLTRELQQFYRRGSADGRARAGAGAQGLDREYAEPGGYRA